MTVVRKYIRTHGSSFLSWTERITVIFDLAFHGGSVKRLTYSVGDTIAGEKTKTWFRYNDKYFMISISKLHL